MRSALLVCLFLAIHSAPVRAGLDLTWDDCVLESSRTYINYTDCNISTKVIRLYSSFKTPVAVPEFIAADLSYDLQEEFVQDLEPFWRFDDTANGGCNSSGLICRVDADLGGRCGGEVNVWDPGGSESIGIFTAYVSGFGASNRGRLVCSIARNSDHPIALAPGVNYYMNHFILSSNLRQTCPGCTGKIDMAWNSATLYERTNTVPVVVTGPDKAGSYVTINTVPDPVRKVTWGRLKSLYR